MDPRSDEWQGGNAYEVYMGRWSRLIALAFIDGLRIAPGKRWLDVGCGTGALTQEILDDAEPQEVWAVDPSAAFIEYARQQLGSDIATFALASAAALPFADGVFDVVVSGLALNFMPAPQALAEMRRVTKPGGLVAAYVWDYGDKMEWLRHFWDAARALDPAARAFDEGERFPICAEEPLRSLFQTAGFEQVEVRPVDVATRFASFDDYWQPFLCGQFPAPQYVASLTADRREALRKELLKRLAVGPSHPIDLVARAWAVSGRLDPLSSKLETSG